MTDFRKIPVKHEYHINKLLVDDGYSNALDPEFKPLVFDDKELALEAVTSLPKECYLVMVTVPEWK